MTKEIKFPETNCVYWVHEHALELAQLSFQWAHGYIKDNEVDEAWSLVHYIIESLQTICPKPENDKEEK